MYEEHFENGIKIKRDLRLLARTLHNSTLSEAADYIDKLEVLLLTAEGNLLAIESRGIEKPISEILRDFKNAKPKTDLPPPCRTKVMEQSPLISENSGYETIQIYR